MAITFVGVTSLFDGDGTSSYSLASSTGLAGDTLIVTVDLSANAGTALTLSTISGGSLTYTQVSTTQQYNTAKSNVYVYVAPNVAGTAAVTVAYTTNRNIDGGAGQFITSNVMRLRGVSTSAPIGNSASANSGQTATFGGGSITVTSGNWSVYYCRQKPDFGQTYTPPTDWTERLDGTGLADTIGSREVPSTTAYNPQPTSTNNWFDSIGYHFEVAVPAGAAAGGTPIGRRRGVPAAILNR